MWYECTKGEEHFRYAMADPAGRRVHFGLALKQFHYVLD